VKYLLGEKFGSLVYKHCVKFIDDRQFTVNDQVVDPPKGATKVGLVHAEDAAAIRSAWEVAKKEQGGTPKDKMRKDKFVANTRAVTYGRFSKSDTVGAKPPCGSPSTLLGFARPCVVTSHEHGVAYTSYKGGLGQRRQPAWAGMQHTPKPLPQSKGLQYSSQVGHQIPRLPLGRTLQI